MKTCDLIGPALEWAVATCEGRDMYFDADGEGPWFRDCDTHPEGFNTDYESWETCGPIIEREGIGTSKHFSDYFQQWMWFGKISGLVRHGPTPLIAAMRCFVASKLGDEIEIPKELE